MTGPRLQVSDQEISSEAWDRLTAVYDPEIGIDLVSLGLIYDLQAEDGMVRVAMSLTTPGCPLSDSMPEAVERALSTVPGVTGVRVDLVWEPAWTPEMMTEAAARQLGLA